jgi:hypothetical protein
MQSKPRALPLIGVIIQRLDFFVIHAITADNELRAWVL